MTNSQIIKKAIKTVKSENSDWKTFDNDDWYGLLESAIDAQICAIYDDEDDDYELRIERLVFAGIKEVMKGKRDKCDPLYDECFDGYDDYRGTKEA